MSQGQLCVAIAVVENTLHKQQSVKLSIIRSIHGRAPRDLSRKFAPVYTSGSSKLSRVWWYMFTMDFGHRSNNAVQTTTPRIARDTMAWRGIICSLIPTTDSRLFVFFVRPRIGITTSNIGMMPQARATLVPLVAVYQEACDCRGHGNSQRYAQADANLRRRTYS